MAKINLIDADAEVPVPLDLDGLADAVEDAKQVAESVRDQRISARGDDVTLANKRDVLAETDQPYVDALDALAAAEKALGRAQGAGPGQTVEVGAATESEV